MSRLSDELEKSQPAAQADDPAESARRGKAKLWDALKRFARDAVVRRTSTRR